MIRDSGVNVQIETNENVMISTTYKWFENLY